MKMIYAIVSNDDSHIVSSALTKAGFFATKIASTGGFLMAGNTTFMIGTEDELVDQALQIIREHSKRRTEKAPIAPFGAYGSFSSVQFVDVPVGGATIFVLDINQFVKC